MEILTDVPVHPRGCGEHYKQLNEQMDDAGSSPRVRGTHDWDNDFLPNQRFIPAGAGNTVATPERTE